MIRYHPILIILFLLFVIISCQPPKDNSFSETFFNKGWLFSKGDPKNAETSRFDDSDWRKLNLPHDWAIEGPFSNKYNARTGGLPIHGKAWYRKHFTIGEKDRDKRIAVRFDGAMSNAEVFINGKLVGERPFGYIGFEVDLTPYIKFGEDNVIAVRLAPEDLASRWYSGAGLYRNVYLKIDNPIHFPQWGTYVTTPKVTDDKAAVLVETTLNNTGEDVDGISLVNTISGPDGKEVSSAKKELNLKKSSNTAVALEMAIANPERWDIARPHLYTLTTEIWRGDQILDRKTEKFGVRTIAFDPNDGFHLNGQRVHLNGVCMHHDLGPLGAAVNYRATERQIQIMKKMGVNALRTSHNPPSPELLEICDSLGIMVIDEAFDEWRIAKVKNGYHKYFDQWHERDLRDMIKRDRNHPSVILWSIGNEILEQGKKDGWKTAKMLNDICHDQDSTRPTTAGFNYYPAAFENKLAHQVDVVGLNYKPNDYAEAKEQNPDMILYGSETSSQTSSRGVYDLPIQAEVIHETKQVSSYDVNVGPPWAYPPDVEFDAQKKNPFLLGEFMWTGFDYLGEPTPYGGRDNSTNGYWNEDWPSHSSYFAPVDLCGFPKDRFYLYQSQWTTKPMVHVLPHWNWAGHEGKIIPVFAYTNADEVELFVNGKSYGKKVKGVDITEIPAEFRGFKKGMYPSKYRLSWDVPYHPGSIKVVAYKNGKEVATDERITAGKPVHIKLTPDRSRIQANGKDLSFITVEITDEKGNICPLADNLVNFKIDGVGSLAGVGNGDSTSLESFQKPEMKAFNGLCLLIVKSTENQGNIEITATSKGLGSSSVQVNTQK